MPSFATPTQIDRSIKRGSSRSGRLLPTAAHHAQTWQWKRRTYSNEEKLAILKRHFVNGERISDICDELVLNPNTVYRWQTQLFENGAQAFETDAEVELKSAVRARCEQACRGKKGSSNK